MAFRIAGRGYVVETGESGTMTERRSVTMAKAIAVRVDLGVGKTAFDKPAEEG